MEVFREMHGDLITQWYETELYIIIDTHTGEVQRKFGGCSATSSSLDEAIKRCGSRNAIIKLNSICSAKYKMVNDKQILVT